MSDIKKKSCRDYVTWRKQRATRGTGESAARHDLGSLQAALNFYHEEYTLDMVPSVYMPEPGARREEWLTPQEVAKLIRAARRRGQKYVARFMLIGAYTGTRSSAIMALRWQPSTTGGWIDVDNGLLYRAPRGHRKTKKRMPPVRIHVRLLRLLRRWRDADMQKGIIDVIHFRGKPIKKMRRSWPAIKKEVDLEQHVVLHTFRHTAVTWLLQAGVPAWEVAGYVGMSVQMIENHYGHHHPDYQANAATAAAPKRKEQKGLGGRMADDIRQKSGTKQG